MPRTFQYRDKDGEVRGIAVGEFKQSIDDSEIVFIFGADERLVASFFLQPGESIHIVEAVPEFSAV